MSAPGYDDIEREAIAEEPRRDERTLDVLYVSPANFRRNPQIGAPWSMTWRQIARWLSRPRIGVAKDCAGAWSPALYRESVRRKSSLEHACALVVDVDQGGDVNRVAAVVGRYRAIVHETFSSTVEAPRCRVVLALAAPIDVETYERTHDVVRAHLRARGIIADNGAKDATRLCYVPVRAAGARYAYQHVDGIELDARTVLAAQPPPPPRSAPRLPRPEHADAYVRGALSRAAAAVAAATPGERHYALSREAYKLARPELSLNESAIEDALLPAFLAAAGDARRREGERTLRDAIRARRAA